MYSENVAGWWHITLACILSNWNEHIPSVWVSAMMFSQDLGEPSHFLFYTLQKIPPIKHGQEKSLPLDAGGQKEGTNSTTRWSGYNAIVVMVVRVSVANDTHSSPICKKVWKHPQRPMISVLAWQSASMWRAFGICRVLDVHDGKGQGQQQTTKLSRHRKRLPKHFESLSLPTGVHGIYSPQIVQFNYQFQLQL